jgi:hypothetical protein
VGGVNPVPKISNGVGYFFSLFCLFDVISGAFFVGFVRIRSPNQANFLLARARLIQRSSVGTKNQE